MIALLAAAAALSFAHVTPLYPQRVTLKGDPGRLRLSLDVDAAYWSNEVLGLAERPPAGEWPAPMSEKALAYLREHLRLRVDGRPLEGRLIGARFYSEPWAALRKIGQEGAEGRYAFELEYPLPPAARVVSGRSLLADSEWKEHLAEPEKAKTVGWRQDFRTIWRAAGKRGRTAETTTASPDVSFDIAEVRRSRAQAAAEALAAPVADWRRFVPHFLLIAAAALWTASAARPRAVVALGLGVALLERPWTWRALSGLFEGRWLGPSLAAVGATALGLVLARLALSPSVIAAKRRKLAAVVLGVAGLAAVWP
jgi:hypothetical protein